MGMGGQDEELLAWLANAGAAELHAIFVSEGFTSLDTVIGAVSERASLA